MRGKTSRTSKFAATVLVMFNIFVMTICLLLFAFGLWIISSPRTLSSLIQSFGSPAVKTLLSPDILTVQLGVAVSIVTIFLFFVSLMGFYGALTRSPFVLVMYSTLMLLMMLLECALLYYFATSFKEKGLQEQDGQWTHAVRLAFQCCEHNSSTILLDTKLPWSCCGPGKFPDNCTVFAIYNKDCQTTVTNWINRYQTAIYASIATLHIVLSSCSLLRRTRSSRSYS